MSKPNQPDRYNCGIKRYFPNPFWILVGWFMGAVCALHYGGRHTSSRFDWRTPVGVACVILGSLFFWAEPILRYIMGAR